MPWEFQSPEGFRQIQMVPETSSALRPTHTVPFLSVLSGPGVWRDLAGEGREQPAAEG